MKIVFYCSEDAPANFDNYLRIGASGTVSALILASHGLASRGHDVTVLNRSESGEFGGVRHIRTESPDEIVGHLRGLGEVDVFIANGWAAKVFLDRDIPAGKRVYWVHNFVDQKPFEEAIRAGRLDYIFCISRNQLGTWWKSPYFDRIGQVYNCIDTDLIADGDLGRPKERKIMFIGAPRESKGFHDALRIFVAFSERNPGFRFYVAGSASLHGSASELSGNGVFEKSYEESHLKDLLYDASGEVRKDVVLLGRIPRDEVLSHLKTTMVALQNPCWDSEPEVHSISALEAQALGVPVLTAFRGGQPEVVRDGRTGVLMKSRDVAAAVRALEEVVGNPGAASRMSEQACRHVRKHFNIPAIARSWEEHLDTVVAGRRFRGNLMKAIHIKVRHKLCV